MPLSLRVRFCARLCTLHTLIHFDDVSQATHALYCNDCIIIPCFLTISWHAAINPSVVFVSRLFLPDRLHTFPVLLCSSLKLTKFDAPVIFTTTDQGQTTQCLSAHESGNAPRPRKGGVTFAFMRSITPANNSTANSTANVKRFSLAETENITYHVSSEPCDTHPHMFAVVQCAVSCCLPGLDEHDLHHTQIGAQEGS